MTLAGCGSSAGTAPAPATPPSTEVVVADGIIAPAARFPMATGADGTVWIAWSQVQTDQRQTVMAARVDADGRVTRWPLAQPLAWAGVLSLSDAPDGPLILSAQHSGGSNAAETRLRVQSWDGSSWRDDFSFVDPLMTTAAQLLVAPDGVAWLLTQSFTPSPVSGTVCEVRRRIARGVWSAPVAMQSATDGVGHECLIAVAPGGDLMATWTAVSNVSTAVPSQVWAARLSAGATRFEPREAIGPAGAWARSLHWLDDRWALLWTVGSVEPQLFASMHRNGAWQAPQSIGLAGESIYSLASTACGGRLDLLWSAIVGTEPGAALRATRYSAADDRWHAVQIVTAADAGFPVVSGLAGAGDGRVAAAIGSVSGVPRATWAASDPSGHWHAPQALSVTWSATVGVAGLPTGGWATAWLQRDVSAFKLALKRHP